MNKIFVLGSINMDLVFEINRIPKLGETIKANRFFMTPGGKGANQAVACAKQGIMTYMIGSVGNDSLSEACIESLQGFGVNCSRVMRIKDQTCGVAGILIEQSDNRIITASGANTTHDIENILGILKDEGQINDYLISQLEIPLDVINNSFTRAKRLGMKTVLNAAPFQPLEPDLLSQVDVLVVNENEMEQLTGIVPDTDKNIDKAIKSILNLGVGSILLTLGENGSVYGDAKQRLKVPAFSVDVVDTTAAGDTYIGAFVSQMLKGNTIKQSMIYATAGAALAIQEYGAQRSIPTNKKITHFLNEKGGQVNG